MCGGLQVTDADDPLLPLKTLRCLSGFRSPMPLQFPSGQEASLARSDTLCFSLQVCEDVDLPL